LYGDEFSTDPETGWQPAWEIDKLIIGDYVQIAADVKIIMGGNNTHNPEFISSYPFLEPKALKRAYKGAGATVIGNDVWLGTACILMPGIKIGNGALVAAYAVVTKDVPAYALVAGNPARILRYRFTEEEIAQLETLKWWEWTDEKTAALLTEIQASKVEALVEASNNYDRKKI